MNSFMTVMSQNGSQAGSIYPTLIMFVLVIVFFYCINRKKLFYHNRRSIIAKVFSSASEVKVNFFKRLDSGAKVVSRS